MGDKLSRVLLAWVLALAVVVGGCEDEKKKPAPTVAAPLVKEVAPSGPLNKLPRADGVMAFGGADKPSAFAGHVSEMLLGSPIAGEAQLAEALSTVAARFGLKDATALDANKPLRIAIADPKTFTQPYVIAIGTTGREAFIKTLPAKHTHDKATNSYSYVTIGSDPVFVSFVDDWAVFTGHKELFGKHKAFMVKLIGATVPDDGSFVVDVAQMVKTYGVDFDKAMERAESEAKKSSAEVFGGDGFKKMVEWLRTVVKDVDAINITTAASKARGKLRFDVTAKTGSSLAKLFASLGKRDLNKVLKELPADAPAVLVSSFDPDQASDLMRSVVAFSLQLSLGQKASEKDYSDAMNEYWKAADGTSAVVAFPFEDKVKLAMTIGVRDAEKMRKSMKVFREMYKEEAVQKLIGSKGLSLTYKPNAYKIGEHSVDTVTAKAITPAKKKKGDKAEKKPIDLKSAGRMGEAMVYMMSSHLAVTKEQAVMVYGADSKNVMEAWLEGKIKGGLDGHAGIKQAMAQAAPGMFLMLYGSPVAVAQAFQNNGKMGPAPKGGIALTMGATGGVLHIVMDVPGDQAKAVAQLVGRLGRGL